MFGSEFLVRGGLFETLILLKSLLACCFATPFLRKAVGEEIYPQKLAQFAPGVVNEGHLSFEDCTQFLK